RSHFDPSDLAWCYTYAYIQDGGSLIAKSKSHKVLGIAPVAIIDRQLPFEYTVTSRSTDVMVMALPVQNINHSAFRSMFEREKLSGNNFNDWFHQLELVLRVKKKMFVIEQPIPPAPVADSTTNELKSMFEKQVRVERFDLIQTFHACKQEKGKPVVEYVLKMKGYMDQLERLGYVLTQDLSVGLILNGLTRDFVGFVRNYNMHNMGKTIDELHVMLIEYEKGLPKKAETPQVMTIRGGKIQKAKKKSLKAKCKGKANGKGNDKQVYIPKPKNPKPSAKEHPVKDDTCHHCKEVGHWKRNRYKEVGHWKRNCPIYLAELLKKKKQVGSASSLEARKLKQGALYLYVGNGVRAQVEAIGSYDLVLPNGLVISLDNCHYAPSITTGVVSVHCLVENRFVQCFTDFRISFSKNNVFYFNVIPSNGIYEIDMHDLVPNVNSIYNVSTKSAKYNLDSTCLWHCRLVHISKKRIEKLQQEGLLKSTDDESFDQCVSCLSGKMTRKSFPHRPKRATDLLGIILTDVCGPLRHVSRQGASYFITFMDDYSCYGYVYLLKHKHEVFETFKMFKNEVENQLGKTIKAFRSDRGGEYISQEFKDYLKACGIVQQLTPSYIPQHNGVSERRNHALLDMVRSMMNLTTLPLSFWDYALESTTHILNMVPTNKVDKTPYELWYGKVLNLSYLKERVILNSTGLIMKKRSHLLLTLDIRILISITAFYDYEIWQMDVKTAFLNGYLDEDIYMVQPKGFFDPKHPRKVCKLQRSIYGLKQASKSCNKRFDEEIKKFGFAQNLDEPCVYQKASGSNVTFLILYVDDIIIMENHIPSLQSVKDYLGKCFAMKDLGEVAFILGIKIYRDRSKRLIGLSQSAYMDKILKRYRMDTSKRGLIPMQERLDLNKIQGASTPEEVKRIQNVAYASAVGSIMYENAVKNILKYLRNTKDMFLVYGGNPEAELQVDCYCDAGFESDRDDIKSQTGYVFVLNRGAVD
ncbi:retrotransposon protein, putative, ty1-copia subclass, partial [Tanacetum coccineum]